MAVVNSYPSNDRPVMYRAFVVPELLRPNLIKQTYLVLAKQAIEAINQFKLSHCRLRVKEGSPQNFPVGRSDFPGTANSNIKLPKFAPYRVASE